MSENKKLVERLRESAPRLEGVLGLPEGVTLEEAECMREAAAALTAAEARIKALSEALEPFDDVLGEDEPHLPDSEPVTIKFGPCADYSLTLGDFRRARALSTLGGNDDR